MIQSIKKSVVSGLAVFLLSSAAQAAGGGSVACDPSWAICLQSMSTDVAGTVHYVNSIQMSGHSIDLPQAPLLILRNDDSRVVLRVAGQSDLEVGVAGEAVGADAKTALSRELKFNLGFDFALYSRPGQQIDRCNATATGFVYEHRINNTTDYRLDVRRAGQVVGEFSSTSVIEPPIRVYNTIFPCRHG